MSDNEEVQTEDQKTCDLLIHNVPEEVKNHFKMACLRQNLTMRDVIIQQMRRYTVRINAQS